MSGFTERLIGVQLGGFTIRRYIARGGMGVVYEGYQPSLERVVAIKVLYPHLSDGAAFIERFQREARAIAQLRHPHIVQIIDTGADQGYHYMAMELIAGRSLRDELIERQSRTDRFSITATLQIINQIGAALAYAHRRGFVHRDVKPGNVLLDADGDAHLSDFGLVKAVGTEGLTQTGAVLGTPEYMAPEQYIATDDVGPASDQYAFAVVAYELLTGSVPFSAPTPVAVIQKHINEPPPSPRSFDPALSAEVEAVLLRGLAKQPAQRYPSVDAFVQELNTAVGAATTMTVSTVAAPVTPAPSASADAMSTPSVAALASAAVAQEPATVHVNSDAAGAPPLASEPRHSVVPVLLAPAALAEGGAALLTPAPVAAPLPMRSPQRSRWLLPLAGLLGLGVIGAIVAAFVFGSGGGNGADPTAGSGNRVGQQAGVLIDATATDEPTATDEISATATVGVAAVGATEVAIEVATARSTTTAVSRPIETTPTPPTVLQPLPFVTGTPQPASGGDQSIALFQDFSTGDPGPFFVGTSAFGDSAIANGTYTLTVQQGNWQARAPDPPLDVGNGGAAVDVSIAGDGAAGMVGRLALQSGGAFTLLACWLNANGSAGCHANDSNTWTELFSVAPGTIAVRDVNRLVMVAVGDQLLFQANDTIIGQVQLAAPGSGNWGMYVASSTGAVTASYKQIVISTVSDNYLTQ